VVAGNREEAIAWYLDNVEYGVDSLGRTGVLGGMAGVSHVAGMQNEIDAIQGVRRQNLEERGSQHSASLLGIPGELCLSSAGCAAHLGALMQIRDVQNTERSVIHRLT
jgi:hypothetical protein